MIVLFRLFPGLTARMKKRKVRIIVGIPTPSFRKNPSSVRLIRLELKAAKRDANNPALFPHRSFAKKYVARTAKAPSKIGL